MDFIGASIKSSIFSFISKTTAMDIINNIANKIVDVSRGQLQMYDGNYDSFKHKDDKVEEAQTPIIKIKPPKIRKGGKW